MTCNVRQPDQDDGRNNWEDRRDLLVETIRRAGPDLIGTQELFLLQAEYLIAGLTGYNWFGKGRFGDTADKHLGIFYRRDSLRLVEHGNFWLSETPDVPGTSSWEIIRPRQVTWGRFERTTGERFYHFNTHFPYRKEEQEARRRAAGLILDRIGQRTPVVLTADFNSAAGDEIHQTLCRHFDDVWLTAERRIGPETTLNGFGRYRGSRRIDWILFRAPWRALEAVTISTAQNGLYPSDHFPVMARFSL